MPQHLTTPRAPHLKPQAQIINATTGEIVKHLGSFETPGEARSRCAEQAGEVLNWQFSNDGLWIAQAAGMAYHVEAEGPTSPD